MTKRRYVKKTAKYLKCSLGKKREIERQLVSDIEIALGEGRNLDDILSEMGDPRALAADFNENFDEKEKRKRRNGKILTVLFFVILLAGIIAGIVYWALPKGSDINDSRFFDKEKVRESAEEVIALFDMEDYEGFYEYASDRMRAVLNAGTIKDIKSQISDDWGGCHSVGNAYMAEIRQAGMRYVLVQINVSYDNVSVIFTLSFDTNMKLIGFYVK